MPRFSTLSPQSQGILFMILCVTFFSLQDATAKALGAHVSTPQVLWARFTGHLVIVLLLFNRRVGHFLKTDRVWFQIVRAGCQLAAAGCFFYALRSQGLAEATAVADLAPVLITLGAALFLGEKIGPRRVLGVLAALCGALIVIRPGSAVFSFASLWPLGTAFFLTVFALVTRAAGPHEPPQTSLVYSGIIGTIVFSVFLPFVWQTPDFSGFALMAIIGVFGAAGQLMMLRAYSHAEAGSVAPFTYAGLLTATLWGLIFFGDVPDVWTIAGALVIIGAGLYVWRRETAVAKESQT